MPRLHGGEGARFARQQVSVSLPLACEAAMTTATRPATATTAVMAVGLITLLLGAAYSLTGGYLAVVGATAVKDLENDPAGGLGFLLQFLAGFVAVVGVVFL